LFKHEPKIKNGCLNIYQKIVSLAKEGAIFKI